MTTPFLGEIKLVPWNYAPRGWAFCDGSTLAISTNQALFALLGTTYGGNGTTTFNLPDLRGRAAMHFSSTVPIGKQQGEPLHTLQTNEMPQHTHLMMAGSAGGNLATVAPGQWLAGYPNGYAPAPASGGTTTLDPSTIGSGGGNQAHENRQPYLCMSYVIALNGIFPSKP